MNGTKIGVLIADDSELIRTLLTRLIEEQPDMAVAGQAANGRQAVALAKRLHPDVVVMDGSMPIMNGARATVVITSTMPHISVVGFSVDPAMLKRMLVFGAAAAVEKTSPPDDLLDAIRRVAARHHTRTYTVLSSPK